MGYRKQVDVKDQVEQVQAQQAAPAANGIATPAAPDATFARVIRHISSGNYQKAMDVLRSAGRDPHLRNALGVCLLRLGRIDDAIRIYRELVLKPGCTWMRPELPLVYKTNFATALLLGGHPAGCQEMLSEVGNESHPTVQRLRAAIGRWEAGLSFWQRLNWRFGSIEPKNCQVPIDFEPGAFEFELTPADDKKPDPNGPNLRTAA